MDIISDLVYGALHILGRMFDGVNRDDPNALVWTVVLVGILISVALTEAQR